MKRTAFSVVIMSIFILLISYSSSGSNSNHNTNGIQVLNARSQNQSLSKKIDTAELSLEHTLAIFYQHLFKKDYDKIASFIYGDHVSNIISDLKTNDSSYDIERTEYLITNITDYGAKAKKIDVAVNGTSYHQPKSTKEQLSVIKLDEGWKITFDDFVYSKAIDQSKTDGDLKATITTIERKFEEIVVYITITNVGTETIMLPNNEEAGYFAFIDAKHTVMNAKLLTSQHSLQPNTAFHSQFSVRLKDSNGSLNLPLMIDNIAVYVLDGPTTKRNNISFNFIEPIIID